MAFGSILSRVGGLGRFQLLQVSLLSIPILLMASHNLLQNFSAAVPPHRCRVPTVTPGLPSATPGVPSIPSATPSIPSATPGIPSATPGIPNATPSIPSATPGIPSVTPGVPSATPSIPSATLGVPSATLIVLSVTPIVPSATPSIPSTTPIVPSATPSISSATLGVPSATLGVLSVNPIVPSATPEPPGPISGGTLGAPGGISAVSGGTLGTPGDTLGTPGDTSGSPDGTLGSPNATLGSCHLYVSPSNGSGGPGAIEPCPHGWDYDRSIYVATIVTEWDLVCGYRQLRQMAQSIYMAGVLVGALLLGGLSDRFGRKALLLWSYLQLGVMGTCTAFAPNYASYCVFRFAGGMALSGFGLSIACLVVEWIPTPYRAVTVAITGFSYTLGQILLAGIAYAVPHWRWLQLTVSLPFFGFFCCSWWLAESARWLVLSGKAEKAVKVLQRVAKINRKKEEGEKITVEILRSNMKEELAALKSSYTVSDLVRTPVIRHIFFCLSIVWFSISFSYYGLAMDLQNFGVSIYLIQVIFGAVDVPAKLVVTVSVSYVGRRLSLMVALFLAGLVIIANIFVSTELQTLRTALAVIGKGCLSASFNCVFLYTTELYPTPIRQTGLGFGSTMARVGGIVAPLVKMTEEYYPFLPPAVYGVAPVVAAVAAGFLPETLNMPLPDTIEEVESRARRKPPEEPKEKIPLQPQEP
ncbi:solute carrier family 22 member 6-A-like [Patagioenas fasciata]|uniref:solute carrier family 22 member 6-A-like n=1 Tax=Patagioenas fasciata TaxID=372321 RepID=UPI003A9A6253